MKTIAAHLKKFLHENREDLLYLLFVGVPTLVGLLFLSPFLDYFVLF
jgi:hypothetical protein